MKNSLARVSLALIALTSLASAQTPDRPALRAAGQDSTYTPLIPGFRARLTGRVDSVSSIITDADGADFTPGPAFDTQLRVNATYDTKRNISWVRLLLEYELVRADVDGDRVRAVVVRDASGTERALRAPVFLEATEEGESLPLMGLEHVIGAEARSEHDEPSARTSGSRICR